MSYQKKISHFNHQLPAEIHEMILQYLSMADLRSYALLSKYNFSLAINVFFHHHCSVTIENVRKRITKKQKPFEELLAQEQTMASYHYYIDHGNLLILIRKVGFEQSKQLLWNILGDFDVAQKIIKDHELMKMLLKEAVPYVKKMMEMFLDLIPNILENETLCQLFLQNLDSKAYLSDFASQSYQTAAYLLSNQNIIKHLLSSGAQQILDPSEYLRDIPSALFKEMNLDNFDALYSEAKKDMDSFTTSNPGTPLPATINQYLRAIIETCQQLLEEETAACDTDDYMQRPLCL